MANESDGRWAGATVLGVALLLQASVLLKPVHIDDALYLAIARQIAQDPLDPYGFVINWQHMPQPAYEVSISPPLLSYWFALVITVFGESVVALHAAMFPWILLACWSVHRLCERCANRGIVGLLLVVGCPAFVVGINLMLDVPLLALTCASVEFAMRAAEHRRAKDYLLAGLCGAAAVLVKYPAVALVPIFLVMAWSRRRPMLAAIAVGPILGFVAWQWMSRSLYGSSQVVEGIGFLARFGAQWSRRSLERSLTMFALSATTFPIWIVALACGQSRRWSIPLAALCAAAAGYLLLDVPDRPTDVSIAFVVAVFLGAIGVLDPLITALRPAGNGWRGEQSGGSDARWPLATWIGAYAAVAVLFAPFVAVRSILPVLPPLAILALAPERPDRGRRVSVGVMIGVSMLLAGLLAWTDFRWAKCYPTAVERIAAKYDADPRPILFAGHWGWQYYAERQGWRPWDRRWRAPPVLPAILVVPLRADPPYSRSTADAMSSANSPYKLIRTIGPNPLRLTTWNRRRGFRFYGGDFGQLPWGFSDEPTEQFRIRIFEIRPSGR